MNHKKENDLRDNKKKKHNSGYVLSLPHIMISYNIQLINI